MAIKLWSAMLRAKYTLKMSVKRILRRKSEPKGKEGDVENCTINYTIRMCINHTLKIVMVIKISRKKRWLGT
jgi:hypothetical protein